MIRKLLVVVAIVSNLPVLAQHEEHQPEKQGTTADVEPQPLLAQAIRLKEALSFLGSSLTKEDEKRLIASATSTAYHANIKACTRYTRSLLPRDRKY